MRTRPLLLTAAVLAAVGAMSGCGSATPPNTGDASTSPVAAGPAEPRAELARHVAAAKDRYFTTTYAWSGSGGAKRTVTITMAPDGTWRADVPGGALGGQVDVSLIGRPDGIYQCALSGCVRVAKANGVVPWSYDVKVHHPFTDWPDILTNRDAALAVTVVNPLPGARGTCYAVEPTTVAIAPPLDAGTFCYDETGLLTGVRAAFGTLVLTGNANTPPGTASLTGPVKPTGALGTEAPAPPPPSTSGSAPAPSASKR